MSGKLKDTNFSTGAVRSSDVSGLDFASLPLLSLLGVMRVAGNGGTKYGRFNYHKGMTVHDTINHAMVHVIRWLLGDRTEPHLLKGAWGLMVAAQTALLQPELCDPHTLGAGAVLTEAMLAEMERGKEDRDIRRQTEEFEDLCHWDLGDMLEVQNILDQRASPGEEAPALKSFEEPETIKTAWGAFPHHDDPMHEPAHD